MTIRSVGIPDFDGFLAWYREHCPTLTGVPEVEEHEDLLYTPASDLGDHRYAGGLFDRSGHPIEAARLVRWRQLRNSGYPEEERGRIGGWTGIYLGWFLPHFGHALLEGLSRCWALGEFDFAVYHGPRPALPEILEFHLDRLGAPPVIIPNRPVSFERLVVPRAAFEIGTRAYTGFLDALPRPRSEDARDPAPVYLSRTQLPRRRRRIVGEEVLEAALDGYRIVRPERLSPAEQLEVFSRHSTFVGPIGSAMHNIVFTRSPRVVYLTDERPAPTYLQCDELVEADSLYVGCCDLGGLPSLGRSTPLRLDLARAGEALGVAVDLSRQSETDRRHREAWADTRLRRGIRQGDRSALDEVREHAPETLGPLQGLVRQLDPGAVVAGSGRPASPPARPARPGPRRMLARLRRSAGRRR